jgi:hypothetical protein
LTFSIVSQTVAISISTTPYRLALLADGLIAVTTVGKVIYLLTVNEAIGVVSRLPTTVRYRGVAGHADGSLIVSCLRGNGIARIDVIGRDG